MPASGSWEWSVADRARPCDQTRTDTNGLPVGRGRLAHAVSQAGGLGMIGIGSTESVDFVVREATIARGKDQGRFGIGMHAWAIQRRPDLLDAAIEARPFLISLSFGSPTPYVVRLHQQGILLATQVNTGTEAMQVVRDGVDLIVAQGTEAGGHVTGQVSTLPLLQAVDISCNTTLLE